ncbi:MAG TPA: hypothetical protein VFD60_00605, partial [Nitrososphaeraceae archaeon]|nr:hypothetical protein [Nitrososphaeraceae archaeon]
MIGNIKKVILLLIGVIGTAIFVSSTAVLISPLQSTIAQQQNLTPTSINPPSSLSTSLPDVFKKVENSVVQIT